MTLPAFRGSNLIGILEQSSFHDAMLFVEGTYYCENKQTECEQA